MPHRSPPLPNRTAADAASLYALWQRMAKFPASEWDAGLQCLMEWIAETIGADNVIWIGAIRVMRGPKAADDPFLGWRLRVRRPLRPDPEPYRSQLSAYYTKDHYGKLTPTFYDRSHELKKEAHVGLTSRASMAGAGKFRVHRLRDGWIDFSAFRRSLHYRLYYEEAGIRDRIWVGFPVTEDRESFFLIDRFQPPGERLRPTFTLRQAALAGDAARGLPEFHRRLFLSSGLMTSDKPMTPTEQEILRGLLTSRSEKEIATALGQKPATLHKYVTALYQRFGVKGRAALMALWLGDGLSPSI